MLAPAFRADSKEIGAANRSQDNMAEELNNVNNQAGVVNINSLLLHARG